MERFWEAEPEAEAERAWGQKEYCPQGHPYNEENTYVDKKGRRSCRVCHRERMRRYREVR